MSMRAARWYDKKDIRIEDVEVPTPDKNEVKIKVDFCGICGSDLHEYADGPIFIPGEEPHPVSGMKAPLTMGHEFAGEVVEVGEGVTSHKVGDKVTIEPIIAEGGLVGKYNLSPNVNFVGLAKDGGFAEYTVVDAEQAHILPDGIDTEQGALAEPAAVALYAVRQSKLRAGDTAAVFGTGPIGLLVIESLKAAGATDIYAVELSEERRQRAKSLGAIPVNPEEVGDVVEFINEQTDGGVHVSFEVTGVPVVLEQALDAVQNDGQCVVVSIWEEKAEFHPNQLVINEKSMIGTIGYRHTFPQVLRLMEQGYFKKEDYITSNISVEDIVEKGFERLMDSKSEVKIMVSPN